MKSPELSEPWQNDQNFNLRKRSKNFEKQDDPISPELDSTITPPAVKKLRCSCLNHTSSDYPENDRDLNTIGVETDNSNRTAIHQYFATKPTSLQELETVHNLIRNSQTAEHAMMHQDFRGMTPLHYACSSHSNVAILRELIKINPSASSIKDNNGNLPLHHYIGCFVKEGSASAESIQILHRSNPQAVSTRNHEGDIPLHVLCKRWHPDSIGDALLRADVNTVKIPDRQGRLPLAIACEWRVNHKLIISMCQLYPEAASVKDLYGDVPLHILCRTYPEDIPEKGIFLALAKASPKMIAIPNADGTLPIQTACEWVLATAKIVLLPEERFFFDWPAFLSEYMCSLEILKCFLKAAPQTAPTAMKFMCDELKSRSSKEYSHLVTALALEFIIQSNHSLYERDVKNFIIPKSDEEYEFQDRRLLLRAILSMEIPISYEAFQILFGSHWLDTQELVKQPFSSTDTTLPLHELVRSQRGQSEQIDSRIVTYLLELYPDATKQLDCHNKLPLHYAVENRLHFDAVKGLFDANPSPIMGTPKTDNNGKENQEEFALSLTAAVNNSDVDVILFLLLNDPSVVRML